MYGMVNRSFEAMLRARHGDAAWERIKARAGVTSLGFISNEPYPDASEELEGGTREHGGSKCGVDAFG